MKNFLKELDKPVYFISLVLVAIMICGLVFRPEYVTFLINMLYEVCVEGFGFAYVLISVGCFVLFFYIYFGKFGNIKLGREGDKPKYSTFSWASMIFTSGAGSSTIILGFAEPIYYLNTTPFHIEPMSEKAFEYAHMYSQFHWGLSAWTYYIPAVVAISYMMYVRKSNSLKISSAMSPVLGEKIANGIFGKLVDILIVFGIIASITTSLGLAVPVLSKLLSSALGVDDSFLLNMIVFGIWFLIFGWSIFRGLDKGIKKLSNFNMYVIFLFLILVAVCSPLGQIISMQLNSTGLYISELPRMIFYTDPFGDGVFFNDWTIFYWGWWLSFLPIMGIFIAKISYGRTMKQVILGQMVWGSLGCCTFLGLLGGYSLYLQHSRQIDLVSVLAEGGNSAVVLAIIETFPFSKAMMLFLCFLCFVFLATTIDSTALVLGLTTSKKAINNQDPHLFNRLSWAIAIFALAIGLTFIGGLSLVQKFAIVLGFPLIFIVILLTISALKAMNEDFNNK